MEHIEMVEKLRERVNVSYEEAKAALEDNNWDLLDAMVQLEREGKMQDDYASSYSTQAEAEAQHKKREEQKEKSKTAVNSFFDEVKRLVMLANDHNLIISKDNNQILSIPISIVIIILLLTLPAFGLIALGAVVAYFFGIRYSIRKGHNAVQSSSSSDREGKDSETSSTDEDFRE